MKLRIYASFSPPRIFYAGSTSPILGLDYHRRTTALWTISQCLPRVIFKGVDDILLFSMERNKFVEDEYFRFAVIYQ